MRWGCDFPTREDYDMDMSTRAASAEFGAAQQTMHAFLDRFERHLERRVDD